MSASVFVKSGVGIDASIISRILIASAMASAASASFCATSSGETGYGFPVRITCGRREKISSVTIRFGSFVKKRSCTESSLSFAKSSSLLIFKRSSCVTVFRISSAGTDV